MRAIGNSDDLESLVLVAYQRSNSKSSDVTPPSKNLAFDLMVACLD